jgi:hypothetical protein
MQILKPGATNNPASHSHTDASSVNDDADLAARVERLEQWAHKVNKQLKGNLASHVQTDTSLASGDTNLAARVETLEQWACVINEWLKNFQG